MHRHDVHPTARQTNRHSFFYGQLRNNISIQLCVFSFFYNGKSTLNDYTMSDICFTSSPLMKSICLYYYYYCEVENLNQLWWKN